MYQRLLICRPGPRRAAVADEDDDMARAPPRAPYPSLLPLPGREPEQPRPADTGAGDAAAPGGCRREVAAEPEQDHDYDALDSDDEEFVRLLEEAVLPGDEGSEEDAPGDVGAAVAAPPAAAVAEGQRPDRVSTRRDELIVYLTCICTASW